MMMMMMDGVLKVPADVVSVALWRKLQRELLLSLMVCGPPGALCWNMKLFTSCIPVNITATHVQRVSLTRAFEALHRKPQLKSESVQEKKMKPQAAAVFSLIKALDFDPGRGKPTTTKPCTAITQTQSPWRTLDIKHWTFLHI